MQQIVETPAPVQAPQAASATSHGHGGTHLCGAVGALVYGIGMFAAMLWSSLSQGDWLLFFLLLPQCLMAAGVGAGAMAMALLAPDPYVAENGKPPATLPDFN